MTREDILRQMAALQTQLDELDKAQGLSYVSASLTEAEKEKQHQEDLQRLRGLRLIDDDFMNACFDGYTDGAELLLRIILKKAGHSCKEREDTEADEESARKGYLPGH